MSKCAKNNPLIIAAAYSDRGAEPFTYLEGDKVNMITNTCTYPHKALRKLKVTICNQQADSPLYV